MTCKCSTRIPRGHGSPGHASATNPAIAYFNGMRRNEMQQKTVSSGGRIPSAMAVGKFTFPAVTAGVALAIQRAMTGCHTSLESMNMRLCALLGASDEGYHIC
jgi:hypothetical protein